LKSNHKVLFGSEEEFQLNFVGYIFALCCSNLLTGTLKPIFNDRMQSEWQLHAKDLACKFCLETTCFL